MARKKRKSASSETPLFGRPGRWPRQTISPLTGVKIDADKHGNPCGGISKNYKHGPSEKALERERRRNR